MAKKIKITRNYSTFIANKEYVVTENVAKFLIDNDLALYVKDVDNKCLDGDCADCEDCNGKKKKAPKSTKKTTKK